MKGNELNHMKILNCLGSPGKRKVKYSMTMCFCAAHGETRTALSTVAVSDTDHSGDISSSTTLSCYMTWKPHSIPEVRETATFL